MEYHLGLLGQDISYSLSPRIFRWGFAKTGLRGEYVLYDLPAGRVADRLERHDWDGLNVTVPHKELVLDFCSALTEPARRAGAANVLFRETGGVTADNTDIVGLEYAVRRMIADPSAVRDVLVIGSGGSARAAIVSLDDLCESAELVVASRNVIEARQRLRVTPVEFRDEEVCTPEGAAVQLERFDLIIQATPVGSDRLPGLPLPGRLRFKPGVAVIDLIYEPRRTAFLDVAERSGARVQNGLVMLIAQAAASFEKWTPRPFPLSEAMEELLRELEAE